MASKTEFLETYKTIKGTDEIITSFLQKAIEYEEQECPIEAIEAYEKAGQKIDEVFKIPVGIPEEPSDIENEWLDACGIIRKLKAAHETVGQRLKVLREQNDLLIIDHNAQEAFETDEAISNGNPQMIAQENGDEPAIKKRSVLLDNPPIAQDMKEAIETYKKYANAIRELMSIDGNKENEVQFDQIFQTQVKMYKIKENGSVETINGEGILTLIMISTTDDNKWSFLNGTSFMQCSLPETPSTSTADSYKLSFIYPLLPSITTVYRTEYDAFIFPDFEASIVDMHNAYGIILSNEIQKINEEAFTDLQQFFLDLLESILAGEIHKLKEDLRIPYQTQGDIEVQPRIARDISEKLVVGAEFIARNLVRGAEKTGEFIDRGTPYVMSKMASAPENTPPVSTSVQRSVGIAKTVTGAAAGATGWIAEKIGNAAVAVGTYLAPHVETQGTKLLERGFGYQQEEAQSKMKGAMTVAAGAAESVATVYGGLERSASVLGSSLSNNSVKIISHKYGPSAGDVAADTFETVSNTWHVSRNLKIVRPKNLAEKVFKKTTIGVVNEYKGKSNSSSKNVIPAGDLKPIFFDSYKKDQ